MLVEQEGLGCWDDSKMFWTRFEFGQWWDGGVE